MKHSSKSSNFLLLFSKIKKKVFLAKVSEQYNIYGYLIYRLMGYEH